MQDYTQLGIAGATLGILFYIVKKFIDELNESRRDNKELTEKFIRIAEENSEARIILKNAITANTEATKTTADNITKLLLKVLKKN